MVSLLEYIEKSSLEKWSWGRLDCVLFTSNWVLEATGIDIAEPIRGKYSSIMSARRLIKKNGGFIPGISAHIDELFNRTDDPKTGDIGIVDAPISMKNNMPVCGAIMAIRFGGSWVCKTAYGVSAQPFNTVSAWSIDCHNF